MLRGISLEGFVFLFFASAMLVTALMSSDSCGADSSERPLSFSNKDLEPYENPADGKPREPQSAEPKSSEVRKTKAEDSKEQREKEYWCKKTAPQRKKIQRLNEEINEKERELAEENAGGSARNKKARTLTKSLEKTRRRLKDAEGILSDLAEEAHRKGVPMGWLRCQFE
jgi:flagellar biosynthesis GTPase FlhF